MSTVFTWEFILWVLSLVEKGDLWNNSKSPSVINFNIQGTSEFFRKWEKEFDSRDRDAVGALFDEEFVFVRYQSGNIAIVVSFRFIIFPSGSLRKPSHH